MDDALNVEIRRDSPTSTTSGSELPCVSNFSIRSLHYWRSEDGSRNQRNPLRVTTTQLPPATSIATPFKVSNPQSAKPETPTIPRFHRRGTTSSRPVALSPPKVPATHPRAAPRNPRSLQQLPRQPTRPTDFMPFEIIPIYILAAATRDLPPRRSPVRFGPLPVRNPQIPACADQKASEAMERARNEGQEWAFFPGNKADFGYHFGTESGRCLALSLIHI